LFTCVLIYFSTANQKEKIMNTQNENQEVNSAYNPFPQPQTIPTGWDTSVFASAQQDDSDDVPSEAQGD
jgi:hypothetical protein